MIACIKIGDLFCFAPLLSYNFYSGVISNLVKLHFTIHTFVSGRHEKTGSILFCPLPPQLSCPFTPPSACANFYTVTCYITAYKLLLGGLEITGGGIKQNRSRKTKRGDYLRIYLKYEQYVHKEVIHQYF